MAVLLSKATGNLTDATATWGVVDATSYLNSETGSDILTTAYSGTRSSAFTPGAITIDGIAVKLSVITGTTGTISVNLELDVGDTQVTGTEVTINCSDLPEAATADLNGGWIFFKFASPVLLIVATAYQVAAKTSSASQVSLFRDGTTDNISRALRTTTEQAPTTGDDVIITKQWTAAATGTAVVITMDSTAATDYGAASTSLVTPAIAICQGGTLKSGVTAATAYILKVSGHIIIYSGGELDFGTVASAMPRDSTLNVTLDCGANVDFGITVRNLGTWIGQGLSRTVSKNIIACKLNTDEAANQTTLGVDTDTGWLDNDVIVVATTTRTRTQTEAGTLNGAAGASSLTVDGFAGAGGGLLNAHSGTSPTQAEVMLLTRNVVIQGASNSLQAFIDIKANATTDFDWVEFKFMGSATANKRGINVATTTGTFTMNSCSIHDFVVSSSRGILSTSTSGSGINITGNCFYNINIFHFEQPATTGAVIFSGNYCMITVLSGAAIIQIIDHGMTFTNNTIVGSIADGVIVSPGGTDPVLGDWSGNTVHGCAGIGFTFSSASICTGTLAGLTSWRNGAAGLNFSAGEITVSNLVAFGNTADNVTVNAGANLTLDTPILNGDTSFATTNGVEISVSGGRCTINSGDLGTVTGIKTAHTNDLVAISSNGMVNFQLNNTKLSSSVEYLQTTALLPSDSITMQKHDQVANSHKSQFRYGLASIDTVIFDATPSLRMAPNSATDKFPVLVGRVNVNSGQVATPTIKVRESVVGDGTDYNGARIRLIALRNDAIGITADTVLATATVASEGAFESISGATIAVTDIGVVEFAIDCGGTTGWINVDTLTVSVA